MSASSHVKLIIVVIWLTFLVCGSLAQQEVVQADVEAKVRFPRLQRVMDGILKTVEGPSLSDTPAYPDRVEKNSPVAGPTPIALPARIDAIVNPVLLLKPGKPGTSTDSNFNGTPVQGVLQFSLQGLPPDEQRALRLQVHLEGPGSFTMPFTGSILARGSDYQDDEFQINLPLSAPPGLYHCQGIVSVDDVRVPIKGTFQLSYPELVMAFRGPERQNTGEPVVADILLQGTPPFRWEWSCSRGEGGRGTGSAFTMNVSSMPVGQLYFTVKAWDAKSEEPTVRTFLIDAEPPTLHAEIKGPTEACVGRTVFYSADYRGGGGGSVSFLWLMPDGSERPGAVSFVPTEPGRFQISLRAIESETHYSAAAVQTLTVYPALKASIEAPSSATPGDKVTLAARPSGGKPPYQYLWINHLGQSAGDKIVYLDLDGEVGETRQMILKVRDSLDPPQEIEVSHSIQLEAGPRIDASEVRVSPAKAEPGKVVKVEIDFDLVNFPPGVHQATVYFWLEGAIGAGKGLTKTQQHSYAGKTLRIYQPFGIDKRVRAGTLRAQVKIVAGGQELLRQSSVEVTRPGGLQDVTVDSHSPRLKIWDHGSEDGDIVSIYLNGNKIAGPGKITKNGAAVGLQLRSGANELVVYAHNEGDVSPNTASIQLTNVVQGPSSQSYSLKKGEKGRFYIVAP